MILPEDPSLQVLQNIRDLSSGLLTESASDLPQTADKGHRWG